MLVRIVIGRFATIIQALTEMVKQFIRTKRFEMVVSSKSQGAKTKSSNLRCRRVVVETLDGVLGLLDGAAPDERLANGNQLIHQFRESIL